MVALLKEHYGVGPTQAKTYYHDDLVVCVLRGGFTRVEQTLLDGDRGRAVIDQRMAVHAGHGGRGGGDGGMRFRGVVRQGWGAVSRRAAGRPGFGFMSENQGDRDKIG